MVSTFRAFDFSAVLALENEGVARFNSLVAEHVVCLKLANDPPSTAVKQFEKQQVKEVLHGLCA